MRSSARDDVVVPWLPELLPEEELHLIRKDRAETGNNPPELRKLGQVSRPPRLQSRNSLRSRSAASDALSE